MLSLFCMYTFLEFYYLAYMVKYLAMLVFVIHALANSSCDFLKKTNAGDALSKNETLLNADKNFAALSATKGLREAYLENIDSNGVLLRPNKLPIVGADAVDFIIGLKDTGYTMNWKPSNAIVASSGDLGYTYGVYEIKSSVIDTSLYGTYVSIWKKQADGKWKFVLQSNIEGIGDRE
jgi:ketosteroid isomerase-like protein